MKRRTMWSRLQPTHDDLTGYAFVAPFLIAFIAVLVVPILYAFYLSLYQDSLIGGVHFAGLQNYLRVLADAKFWDGFANTLLYGAILIPAITVLSVAAALVLDHPRLRGGAIFRVALFLPYVFPGVIAALVWGYLYGPVFGPISQIAHYLHEPVPPLLSDGWLLFSMANITIWELLGYKAVIVYTAMKAIPVELEEAATVDGCGHWHYAMLIKVPIVGPAILLNTIFSIVGTFQLFNQPQILQALAPAVVSDSYTPNLYARNLAFVGQEYNYAGAISFVLAAIIATLSYVTIYAAAARARRVQNAGGDSGAWGG